MKLKSPIKRFFAVEFIVLVLASILLSLFLGCQPSPANSQETITYVYTVKFVCVPEVGPAQAGQTEIPFEPGFYRTVVNVHNFQNKRVKFTKKAVLARSQFKERGLISKKITEVLDYDQALGIGCFDILKLFGGPQPIGDGFVVIESRDELDVVAVYTALPQDTTQGVSIDVEYIKPKIVRGPSPQGKADLVPVEKELKFCNTIVRGDTLFQIVTVENIGSANAGASTTRVTFSTSSGDVVVDVPTPALPAGSGPIDLPPIPIPPGCFIPDCIFKISVDVNNDVVESNEGNNMANGTCIG